MAGQEPPKLNTETALSLVVSAWSLTWAGLGSLALVFILVLEASYKTFDKVALLYLDHATIPAQMAWLFNGETNVTTLHLQEVTLMLFGFSMICTGLAIAPLYQKDLSAAAFAPEGEKSGA